MNAAASISRLKKVEQVKRECASHDLRIIPRGIAFQIIGRNVDLWVHDLAIVVLPRDLLPAKR